MQTHEIITLLIVVGVGVGGSFVSKLKVKTPMAQVFSAALLSVLFGYIIIGIERAAIKSAQGGATVSTKPSAAASKTAVALSDQELLQEAAKASKRAYAPYSKIKVGAAVLSKSNKLYTAANVENASYGLTICAERVAICKAISEGDTAFKAIAISSTLKNITPCGACRQFIAEFGGDTKVIYKYGLEIKDVPVSELLPYTFHTK